MPGPTKSQLSERLDRALDALAKCKADLKAAQKENVRLSDGGISPKVVHQRVEVPVEKIIRQRIEVPVEKIIRQRIEVPVEKIVTKRVEVPVEKIVTKRVEVPVEKVVEREVKVRHPSDAAEIKRLRKEVDRLTFVDSRNAKLAKENGALKKKAENAKPEIRIVEKPIEKVITKRVKVDKIVERQVHVRHPADAEEIARLTATVKRLERELNAK